MIGVAVALRAGDRRFGIVYVDAHADYRLGADSPTGEPADLVLTALTGRIPGPFGRASLPLAREDDIVVFGYREPDRIAESTIPGFERARTRRMGFAPAVRQALQQFAGRASPAWVHFDVDVLDPSVMPAVEFTERDGLSRSEVEELLRASFGTLSVVGLSVACYHPRLDADGEGARIIVELVSAGLPAGGGEMPGIGRAAPRNQSKRGQGTEGAV